MGRQAGQGKLGCVIWVLALAIAGMVAYKMIPVRVQAAELTDFMIEQAQFASHHSPEDLRKAIADKAHDLGLPLREEDIKIDKERDRIKMEADYTVPVEFPGYTYLWHFHPMVDRPIFIT